MRRNILLNIIYSLILLFVAAGEAITVMALKKLDMLPPLYFGAVIALFAIFTLLIAFFMFVKGKKMGKGRQIIACVLSVLVVCGCAVITTVATDVVNTLEATLAEPEEEVETATRAIYVMSRNPINEVAQTVGYTYGYVKDVDEICSQQVLGEVRKQTDDQIYAIGYNNMFTMITALLNDRIDAMILDEAYLELMDGMEGFENFDMQAKLLSNVPVDEPENAEDDLIGLEMFEQDWAEEDEPVIDVDIPEEIPEETEEEDLDFSKLKPFIIYVSGSDARAHKLPSKGRNDVNILVVVNPMTKQVLLLNTPRDYYVSNPAAGGRKDKLAHCGVYGFNNSIKTLNNLYGIKADYYIRVNFNGFMRVIDAMGGITVYSDVAFTVHNDVVKIKKGENHLGGKEALAFARTRKALAGGDNDRGKNQMKVIEAVIQKATSGTTVIKKYSKIIKSIDGMFQMTVPADLISELMKMQLSDMARWNVVSYAVTGSGGMDVCASAPSMKLSITRPHQSSVNKAKKLIQKVKNNEILTKDLVDSI